MMNDIKPIETEYNGYRFRSRLEARWAVFFDAMGIKYEYEPEGYVLQDGECYLPDFRLHVRHRSSTDENEPVYAEVKGLLTPKDEHKCSEFSTCYPLILLGNIPADCNEYTRAWVKDKSFFSFRYIDGLDRLALFSVYKGDPWICEFGDTEFVFKRNPMHKALEKARKARFEHGEKPNKTRYEELYEEKKREVQIEARRRQLFHERFLECFFFSKCSIDKLAVLCAYGDKAEVLKWINGYTVPNIDCIDKLASVFGVSVDWLYGAAQDKERFKRQYQQLPDLRGLADKLKEEMRI